MENGLNFILHDEYAYRCKVYDCMRVTENERGKKDQMTRDGCEKDEIRVRDMDVCSHRSS